MVLLVLLMMMGDTDRHNFVLGVGDWGGGGGLLLELYLIVI